MALNFESLPESEILDFHQREGENMKKDWDGLFGAHKRIMPWTRVEIVLRYFYHGLFSWCKQSLDIIAEEDSLECKK